MTTYFNLQYMFRHSNVFFSFIQNTYTIYKLKCSRDYMVLCNPFPDTSFTVKKTKILTKIIWLYYLAITNYIVQYKLQYGKDNGE